ncbi:OmpA family protein [Ochrobactrum sp. Marseille-Q0166]|uniref:OmpA family protein n=1 Tax=Ochrobactrum sp. Marseille-Q0166 TaxID=2761105 RepID=UPI001655404F|nr:OmpA family protein [Ochrobactrum sp. Marseille-Q0166]MBC8719405.1 OmpA family protein [Ochrobactrum sp. Marseille-Q0166]
MPIRSKRLVLLATVFAPAISLSIDIQPSIAQPAETSVILAQDSSEEFPQDQNLEQQQAEEEARRAAEEQQRAAEEENRRQAEEQQRAAQEEADRQADEQRRIAEQAQREAIEQQRAAEQQRANEEELKDQAEQARQKAESEQRAAEEQMRQRAEEEKRIAHEEAEKQARAQEKAAEEAKRNAAEHQAGEEQQRAVEEQARQKAAEESAKQEIENLPSAPVEETKSEAPAAQPSKNEGEEEQPTPPIVQEAPQPQPEAPVEQPTEQPRVDHSPEVPTPQPEIVDQLTTEEKREIAKDPAKSDETVVLPVENGAAVLDSDKDADNRGGNLSREDRRKQREQQRVTEENTSPPADDAAAQVAMPDDIKDNLSQKIEANLKEEGKRIKDAPAFAVPETTNIIKNTVINNTVINNTAVNNIDNSMTNVKVIEQIDNRVILDVGDRIFVRGDDRPRLRRDAERSYYDELPGGRMRETIVRPGGYEIVTVYNRYGDILQRTRIDRDGNEYLMMYAPEYDDGPRAAIVDVGYELPPMRLTVPVRDYIIDVADDPDRDFYDFLARPPVERVERVYTIDEVRHSARLRDKVRRIDLDTIHFATGSAEVSLSQAKTLRKVADAMHKVLQKDPGETFFIEGHTDAVGSDRSNLILSDRRAESVASLLTEVYDIPAENLVTQGYGERFLKIRTQAAEQENRRVTIRRVTPLVRPVAQR